MRVKGYFPWMMTAYYTSDDHQLIMPETLVREVIKKNHDPGYVAHPGTKRTHGLIALHYW